MKKIVILLIIWICISLHAEHFYGVYDVFSLSNETEEFVYTIVIAAEDSGSYVVFDGIAPIAVEIDYEFDDLGMLYLIIESDDFFHIAYLRPLYDEDGYESADADFAENEIEVWRKSSTESLVMAEDDGSTDSSAFAAKPASVSFAPLYADGKFYDVNISARKIFVFEVFEEALYWIYFQSNEDFPFLMNLYQSSNNSKPLSSNQLESGVFSNSIMEVLQPGKMYTVILQSISNTDSAEGRLKVEMLE